jgi:hypothetical protein
MLWSIVAQIVLLKTTEYYAIWYRETGGTDLG